ncbi:MAG: response regulator [Candidatus Omnitrophica bacterium]|nr:response regulator [Candidatus Omnitrophota bacterium]
MAPAVTPPPGTKILVVDDDPGVLEMLRDYFSSRAFDVATANTAFDALKLAFHERPDTLILDLGLPDYPGEEVLRRVKKFLPSTRVMILTGRSDPELEPRLRNLGCDSFLLKGTPLKTLEETILSWTPRTDPGKRRN